VGVGVVVAVGVAVGVVVGVTVGVDVSVAVAVGEAACQSDVATSHPATEKEAQASNVSRASVLRTLAMTRDFISGRLSRSLLVTCH